MTAAPAEALGRVLAADFEPTSQELAQGSDRHPLARNLDPTASITSDTARHDERVLLDRELVLLEGRREVRKATGQHDGFDRSVGCTRSYDVTRGAPSRQERESAQHQGFPGAGLPGQYI